ncbi:GrpB family protein [Sphingobacterium sp. MYb388]|uniref:GrpB family protein n=1 Tax=Sphingobacterium sp. MYb388 TaxID=2745437 RepID=UPI0030AB3407
MILPFEPYNPTWKDQFNTIKRELDKLLLPIKASVDHIGSTSVEGLSAKPIIDIIVGLEDENDLDKVPALLANRQYVYYEKYNIDMPYRRFFVLLREKPDKLGLPTCIGTFDKIPDRLNDHALRIAHIHVIPKNSENWVRHIAFRDYLRTHPNVKDEYQALKEGLIKHEWQDGNDYNEGKDAFLQVEEKRAIEWYLAQK